MSDSAAWIYLTELKDLPQNVPRLFYPKGLGMLLLHQGADVFALSNRCPHMGCALASGTLEGDLIRCPCHDWAFDVRTGELIISREIRLPMYPTLLEGGKVFVRLED
jgi:3-phenylpropionate/trans-cinnamate dioxygenase ferredoxin subunit